MVKFRTTGKVYHYPPYKKEELKEGDRVVIETPQGLEIGTVIKIERKKPEGESEGQIIRKFSLQDKERLEELKPKRDEAKEFFNEKVKELGLCMKLIDVEISLDERKITFYFVSEERVDFRELLSLLVAHFHKNIRLQQIGPRDAAKMLGGFGPCGRPFCCALFREMLESISLDLAEEQDLQSVGASKITGPCGKLLCCLEYEADFYREMKNKLPKIGDKIKTKKGIGTVISQNVLTGSVILQFDDETTMEYKVESKGDKNDL